MFNAGKRLTRRVSYFFVGQTPIMHLKIVSLVLAYAIASCSATYYDVAYTTQAGNTYCLPVVTRRTCVCVKNVQTHTIGDSGNGITRLFSSTDCTGAYSEVHSASNTEWVNSVSYGPSGTSIGPSGCPSSFGSC
ncbi:hypothetical protein BC940DRAFT_307749 [Gongronella butleri]|nr:hypothetical protein BC940DRAFT_307749 [Gongronella butleri]